MPQASDDLRRQMAKYFPEDNEGGIADAPVYAFLAGLGLVEARGIWMVPPEFPVTSKILNCLNFMCDEWDYDWKWEGTIR